MMRRMLTSALSAIGLQGMAQSLNPMKSTGVKIPVKVVGSGKLAGRSTGSNQRKRRKRERQLRGGGS